VHRLLPCRFSRELITSTKTRSTNLGRGGFKKSTTSGKPVPLSKGTLHASENERVTVMGGKREWNFQHKGVTINHARQDCLTTSAITVKRTSSIWLGRRGTKNALYEAGKQEVNSFETAGQKRFLGALPKLRNLRRTARL